LSGLSKTEAVVKGLLEGSTVPAGKPPIGACSLLPKELVEKYFQNKAVFPYMKAQEEAIGANGSGCSYGSRWT
jgi:hypothetical protein